MGNNIAFVPIRSGSKSITQKNLKLFCGKPLFYWVINSLEKSKSVDKIILASNIDEVKDSVNFVENNGCDDLTILHCVSSYPVQDHEVNLGAIGHMKDIFNWPIGWSDHSRNLNVVVSSVLRWGATTVEMYIDLDGKGEEFAPGHCWLPSDAAKTIKICKESENFIGSCFKEPAKSEISEREWRADPKDGLRPFISVRKDYKP